jgi:hypothetical protein
MDRRDPCARYASDLRVFTNASTISFDCGV